MWCHYLIANIFANSNIGTLCYELELDWWEFLWMNRYLRSFMFLWSSWSVNLGFGSSKRASNFHEILMLVAKRRRTMLRHHKAKPYSSFKSTTRSMSTMSTIKPCNVTALFDYFLKTNNKISLVGDMKAKIDFNETEHIYSLQATYESWMGFNQVKWHQVTLQLHHNWPLVTLRTKIRDPRVNRTSICPKLIQMS